MERGSDDVFFRVIAGAPLGESVVMARAWSGNGGECRRRTVTLPLPVTARSAILGATVSRPYCDGIGGVAGRRFSRVRRAPFEAEVNE